MTRGTRTSRQSTPRSARRRGGAAAAGAKASARAGSAPGGSIIGPTLPLVEGRHDLLGEQPQLALGRLEVGVAEDGGNLGDADVDVLLQPVADLLDAADQG